MRPLSPRSVKLAERMRAVAEAALGSMPDPDLAELRSEIRQLKDMLGGAGAGAGAAPDRVREQVSLFRRTGTLPDVRAARLVCWGTTLRDGRDPALIEDRERFPGLIDGVDEFRDMRRPYRRCWRGLLDGYVRYDPGDATEAGRRNWTMLRDYLNANLPSLERSGSVPDWLSTIDEHPNLLGERPCARYGAALLEGDAKLLEPLRRDLSMGDSSWLTRRIFEAQIDAAVNHDDRALRRIMPRLVALLAEHDLLADGALVRVLDRWARCRPLEVEAELRDLSVARWGNPWLERNDTQWTRVEAETRQMVSSWLKLSLIEKFFSLLSEDKLNDQRRVAFWKRYVDRIDDMHFALGEAAYTSPSADFRALRKAMAGKLLRLDNGGVARNNAFIMRLGGHVVVEFGEHGNAMYAFDAASAPFDLRRPSISGNRTALKHPSHVARITHTDGGERWERKFERRLAEVLGRAGKAPTAALSTVSSPTAAPPIRPAPTSIPTVVPPVETKPQEMRQAASEPHAVRDLHAFLAEHRVKFADLRDKGGSLWAYAPERGPAADGLRSRGFAWSARRGAWFLKS
ncbi:MULTISPECIES: EH signature domain-containing protein [Sphingomonas]|uniref:EH signature domain-containing protein n=1 Tax=Sphingomonas molluscorum TaxID=418184 RepID=A0ABU8Q4Y2_9SPHN|nr:EH signature domain-containing protein [Sphingomonas sp. JUb134]MBM7406248.1 hypothetical protein [Sphingomonas sp. JUb134]